ncbi:MAG: hypothetical protein RLN72_16525 [Henriciella sp.]
MKRHAALVLSAFVLAAGCASAPAPVVSAALDKPVLEGKSDKQWDRAAKDIRRGEKLVAEGRSELERQDEKARKARADLRKAEDRVENAKADIRKGERLVEEGKQVQAVISARNPQAAVAEGANGASE